MTVLILLTLSAALAHNGQTIYVQPGLPIALDGALDEWDEAQEWFPITEEDGGTAGEFALRWNPQGHLLEIAVRMDSSPADSLTVVLFRHAGALHLDESYGDLFSYWIDSPEPFLNPAFGRSEVARTGSAVAEGGLTKEYSFNLQDVFSQRSYDRAPLIGVAVCFTSAGFRGATWAEEESYAYLLSHTSDAVLLTKLMTNTEAREAWEKAVSDAVHWARFKVGLAKTDDVVASIWPFLTFLVMALAIVSSVLYRSERIQKGYYSFVAVSLFSGVWAVESVYDSDDYRPLLASLLAAHLMLLSKSVPEIHNVSLAVDRLTGAIHSRFSRQGLSELARLLRGAYWVVALPVLKFTPLAYAVLTAVSGYTVLSLAFLRIRQAPMAFVLRVLIYSALFSVALWQIEGGALVHAVCVVTATALLAITPFLVRRVSRQKASIAIGGLAFGGSALYLSLSDMLALPGGYTVYRIGFGIAAASIGLWVWGTAQYRRAEEARREQELEQARRLQLSMLPVAVPNLPGVEVGWMMETATEVGGDYYDYSLVDGTVTIVLGDATGHGMQAGVMS